MCVSVWLSVYLTITASLLYRLSRYLETTYLGQRVKWTTCLCLFFYFPSVLKWQDPALWSNAFIDCHENWSQRTRYKGGVTYVLGFVFVNRQLKWQSVLSFTITVLSGLNVTIRYSILLPYHLTINRPYHLNHSWGRRNAISQEPITARRCRVYLCACCCHW